MRKLVAATSFSAMFLFAAVPLTAQGGVRDLWPSQFMPASTAVGGSLGDAYGLASKGFYFLGSTSGNLSTYESEVQLPAGATITRLAFNGQSRPGSTVSVFLFRMKNGGIPDAVASHILMDRDYPRGWYREDDVTLPSVDAGYRYWVRVDILNNEAAVFGVRLSYR